MGTTSPVITVTRQFRFDAAHRVLGHGGKCRFLHGHSYLVEVTVSPGRPGGSGGLDALGMVLDFSLIKERVGQWIDSQLDHNTILNPLDPLVNWAGPDLTREVMGGRDPFVMPPQYPNPTAENLARLLHGVASTLLGLDFRVTSVRVWETEKCCAEYREEHCAGTDQERG